MRLARRPLAGVLMLCSLAALVACGGGGDGDEDPAAQQQGAASASGASGGAGASGASGAAGQGGSAGSPFASEDDLYPYSKPPKSCAYQCPNSACAEATTPYKCPALADYKDLPHAESCGLWDGTMPAAKPGQCTASEATGEAAKYGGVDPDDPSRVILPDGRRLKPAGSDWVFDAQKQVYESSGLTTALARVPGSSLVLTVDTGNGDHVVRVVDTSKIDGSTDPVVSEVKWGDPFTLNQSVAFAAPDRVYVATAQGMVQALKLDVKTGKLEKDDARSVKLPSSSSKTGSMVPYYVAAVAVSKDGTRLFVTGVDDKRLVVADITPGGADYGKELGEVDLGADETFGVYVDPHEPQTSAVFVTMWGTLVVKEIDVSNPAQPQLKRSFDVGKNPQGIAFPDGRWVIVGNDLGDSFSFLDRTTGQVTTIAVDEQAKLKGLEPSAVAYDEARKRLYAALAGQNAVAAFDVDLSSDTPKLSPAGRLPSQWWPSGITVMDDGALVVTSLMGRGHGPLSDVSVDSYNLLHGGIQRVPSPTDAELKDGEAFVLGTSRVGETPGVPAVSCPPGVMDFPVPPTNEKPSPVIEHVFVVVRENKNYEGLFGDFPGGKSQGKVARPGADMDKLWMNIRQLARTFALSDNFYNDATLSEQGHVWTAYGRTNDFTEREWPVTTYGRSTRPIEDNGGVPKVGRTEEGSVFEWMMKNNVKVNVFGEIVGQPIIPNTDKLLDQPFAYPGGIIQNIGWPDVEKACYVGARAKAFCDLGKLVYMTLPNDHTQGTSPSSPSPDTMIAVNDEATGMLVDLISHSPLWPKSLIIITEDDPSQDVETVDYHRSVFVLASPWVKRGYMSHTHADVSSIYKIVAHALGVPYPNLQVQNAVIPYDIFTSTPDYTPFTYAPRVWPLSCGKNASAAEQKLTESWDFSEEDKQPGLSAQVSRWLRGTQYQTLPPEIEADIARRAARKAWAEERGLVERDAD